MGKFLAKTSFLGKNVKVFEELDSTNSYLIENVQDFHEGDVVLAVHQVNGRGQGENKWESESSKNLTFSLLLCPSFVFVKDQFVISKMIAVSIASCLESLGLTNVTIKWPNDIYVGENKVAGVLIENVIQGGKLKSVIVGIGLNVCQEVFNANINATSIKKELSRDIDLEQVYNVLLIEIEKYYLKLRSRSFQVDDYRRRLFRLNQNVVFLNKQTNTHFNGELVGVDLIGRLVLRVAGEQVPYFHDQIKMII